MTFQRRSCSKVALISAPTLETNQSYYFNHCSDGGDARVQLLANWEKLCLLGSQEGGRVIGLARLSLQTNPFVVGWLALHSLVQSGKQETKKGLPRGIVMYKQAMTTDSIA